MPLLIFTLFIFSDRYYLMKKSTRSILRDAVWMAAACLLCACSFPSPGSRQAGSPAVSGMNASSILPAEYYRQAEAQGKNILHVDARQSLLVLEVRRDGPFARLGHDHVVSSHDVSGFVAPDAGHADLSVPLDKLTVDEKELRAAAGFDSQPTADDIAGTRHNMLAKVLEAQRFPLALIHIVRHHDAAHDAPMLDVTIRLHGISRTYPVPAIIRQTADGMIVSGSMQFRQSDFGITPFSILNGAIRVRDELALRFRIVAERRQT